MGLQTLRNEEMRHSQFVYEPAPGCHRQEVVTEPCDHVNRIRTGPDSLLQIFRSGEPDLLENVAFQLLREPRKPVAPRVSGRRHYAAVQV